MSTDTQADFVIDVVDDKHTLARELTSAAIHIIHDRVMARHRDDSLGPAPKYALPLAIWVDAQLRHEFNPQQRLSINEQKVFDHVCSIIEEAP